MNSTRRTALQLTALVLCGPAWAGAEGSAALPSELEAEFSGLQRQGAARMRFFGFDIYDARLWVSNGFRAEAYTATPFALELNYLRSLSGKAIAERSLKEMQRQGSFSPEQEKTWLATMVRTFPDVKAGDRITGAHVPGSGARFWFNGQPLATVRDTEFSRVFFGIWLSDATSEPQLRASLLGRAAS